MLLYDTVIFSFPVFPMEHFRKAYSARLQRVEPIFSMEVLVTV